jgi:hypothetical protein
MIAIGIIYQGRASLVAAGLQMSERRKETREQFFYERESLQ